MATFFRAMLPSTKLKLTWTAYYKSGRSNSKPVVHPKGHLAELRFVRCVGCLGIWLHNLQKAPSILFRVSLLLQAKVPMMELDTIYITKKL